jgi:sterol desaturase/sphingolipid hydroxylase (fatty acid hydroxylase superfamily)
VPTYPQFLKVRKSMGAQMNLMRLTLSASGILESVLCACLVAELAGYWLHRLLHSDKLPFLSRGHMIHHLFLYGPEQPLHTQSYKDATSGRFALGNVGIEWLLPSAVVLGISWLAMALLRVPPLDQAFAIGTLLAWPFVTFSYLHDRMHLQDSWMARSRLLRGWFARARRLHDIHHRHVNDDGRMDTNFGIGFHFFDRVFRTLAMHHRPLNRRGFEVAKRRYGLPALPSKHSINVEGAPSIIETFEKLG